MTSVACLLMLYDRPDRHSLHRSSGRPRSQNLLQLSKIPAAEWAANRTRIAAEPKGWRRFRLGRPGEVSGRKQIPPDTSVYMGTGPCWSRPCQYFSVPAAAIGEPQQAPI